MSKEKPKLGRPFRVGKKYSDERFTVRLTEAEAKQVRAEAERAGLTVAEYIRRRLLED